MSVELIAELSTSHGGDVELACEMVRAAADSGAHTVKIQSYTLAALNPKDPQADWLRQAHLDEAAHVRIMEQCEQSRVRFLSTPFDVVSLRMLIRLGLQRIKVPSSLPIWPALLDEAGMSQVKSWPWGVKGADPARIVVADLTAIPLYPTPLEAVRRAPLLDGWSDHTIGTAACQYMIASGATIIEKHFSLPGKGRNCAWDATSVQFREIRDWADAVETMTTGVSQIFRERWRA